MIDFPYRWRELAHRGHIFWVTPRNYAITHSDYVVRYFEKETGSQFYVWQAVYKLADYNRKTIASNTAKSHKINDSMVEFLIAIVMEVSLVNKNIFNVKKNNATFL